MAWIDEPAPNAPFGAEIGGRPLPAPPNHLHVGWLRTTGPSAPALEHEQRVSPAFAHMRCVRMLSLRDRVVIAYGGMPDVRESPSQPTNATRIFLTEVRASTGQ